jgi:uncharacterized protein YciU (UPF0263 family)
MAHRYKRRTYAEAEELAREQFLQVVAANLTPAEIEEIQTGGLKTGGTPGSDWAALVGLAPTEASHYEVQIYKPAAERPYVEKSFVRMLVPRDRNSKLVHFIWRPEPNAG